MKHVYKWIAVVTIMALLVSCGSVTAFATEGYGNNALNVATEPGGTSEFVTYIKNGLETPLEEMTWVDGGLRAKALELDGKNTYLKIGAEQLRTSQFTFSTWIHFRGSVDPSDPSGAYNQYLFTIGDEKDCYFAVSPHAMNETILNDEGMLNGIYMAYYRQSNTEGVADQKMIAFDGTEKGINHFGLPQNEWHHMAVVVESMAVKLYVDGNLIFNEDLLMPVAQLSAEYMTIGSGLWNNPTLNALLDDVLMFDIALTQEQIVALMQTGAVAVLDNPGAHTTTKTVYMPTTAATTTTTTAPVSTDAQKPEAPFGLPMWGFGVVVGLVGVIVVITVIVNGYEISLRRAQRIATSQDRTPEDTVDTQPEEQEGENHDDP